MIETSFALRQLTEADAAALRELRLRALREEPAAFGSSYEESLSQPIARTAERLRSQAGGDSFTLGAHAGATLVGTLTLVREQGVKLRHKGMVVAVYVAPEARGRGVGRALLRTAIDRAQATDGLEQLHLTVTATNESARRLYHSVGFVEYGVEPRALKLGEAYLDEVLMVLQL